jgi:hypothetical protein
MPTSWRQATTTMAPVTARHASAFLTWR